MLTDEKNPPMPATFGHGHFRVPGEQDKYGQIDSEAYEQQCALLEHNEQAAKRRAYENEYWRQRTLARQFQSRASAQSRIDRKDPDFEDSSLEAMDSKQRVGEILNIFMDEYNNLKPSALFFDWVSCMTSRTQTNLIRKVMEDRQYKGTVRPSWVRTFNRGIRYMNAGERSSYQIKIKNGLLYQNGIEFDTSKMKTRFSGTGVAIFIQGTDGTFYSSSHIRGRLQQPSDQSNSPVRSAGEWKVDHGRIEWITGESGFYKPTMVQLVNAVNDLKFQKALSQSSDNNLLPPTTHEAPSTRDRTEKHNP